MSVSTARYSQKGQGLLEVMVGLLVLVPIGLAMLDLAAIVLANQANDEIAKRAARAAASQSTLSSASTTVRQLKDSMKAAGMIKTLDELSVVEFATGGDQGVRVRSRITLALPVPIPFIPNSGNLKFVAEAVEPIVGIEAEAI